MENKIEIYQESNSHIVINVKFDNDTVWLSQQQMAESSRTNIVEHIKHIYEEGELNESSTCRNFRQVQLEGNRNVSREIPFYNLDMIISLGYRIKSSIAAKFRQWAILRLKEYLVQSYTITKNHSFVDGNKRIAAACFLYFFEQNNSLLKSDSIPTIDNSTLAAVTIVYRHKQT
jgi:hypothetical protein